MVAQEDPDVKKAVAIDMKKIFVPEFVLRWTG